MKSACRVTWVLLATAVGVPSVSFAQSEDPDQTPAPPSAAAIPPTERPDFSAPPTPASALPRDTLTTDPLQYVVSSTYSIEYERVLTRSVSAFVSPRFVALTRFQLDAYGNPFGTFKVRAGGATLGARYFFFGEAPRGLFVSLLGSLLLGTTSFIDPSTGSPIFMRGYQVAGGLLFGYSLLILDRIPISLGIGGQATFGNVNLVAIPGFTLGGGFVLRTNIGFAF